MEAVEQHQDELLELRVGVLHLERELIRDAYTPGRRRAQGPIRLEAAEYLLMNLEHHLQVAEQEWETAADVAAGHPVHLSLEGVLRRLEESQAVVQKINDAHIDVIARTCGHQLVLGL